MIRLKIDERFAGETMQRDMLSVLQRMIERIGDDESIDGDRHRDDVAIFFVERQKHQVDAAVLQFVHHAWPPYCGEPDLDGRVQRVEFPEQQRKIEKGIQAGARPDVQ